MHELIRPPMSSDFHPAIGKRNVAYEQTCVRL